MAKRTKIFRVDVTVVERRIALLEATGKKEEAKTLARICNELGILFDPSEIKTHKLAIEEIANALKTAK